MAHAETTAMPGAPVGDDARPLPRVAHAGRIVAMASALGVIGQLLFFGVGLGVNFPIAVALLLLGGWLIRRRTPGLRDADAWLAPAALAFASFAALRADPTIVALDLLTAMALAGAALATFGGLRVADLPFTNLVALGLRAVAWAIGGAFAALAAARGALAPAAAVTRHGGPALPVLRGLLIAIPVVLVFVALFSAADAVFATIVGDVFAVRLDFGDLVPRLVIAAVLAWVAAGALAFVGAEHDEPVGPSVSSPWRIGTVEAVTVLAAVNAVFALFVALQAAYLFGGLDTLQATGLTYAEYARRGFFELVAVAVLAGLVIIGFEQLARHRSRALIASCIGLAVLTGVILASAALRLRLYQEAYGWTELRLYVLATIVLLAVGVVALLAQLALDRVRWFGHALVAAALVIGFALNVLGPARFITEQNVARVLDPSLVPPNGRSGLDEDYALSLGDDAIPSLVRVIPELDGAAARVLGRALTVRLEELRSDGGLNAWQAWNAGRSAARSALEGAAARGDLP